MEVRQDVLLAGLVDLGRDREVIFRYLAPLHARDLADAKRAVDAQQDHVAEWMSHCYRGAIDGNELGIGEHAVAAD